MVPPIELEPYKVPCGPRSTSTRSTSNRAGSITPRVESRAALLEADTGTSSR
jgi:hypothetical protein